MQHRTSSDLETAYLPASAATARKLLMIDGSDALLAYGTSLPSGDAGYAVGCIFFKTDGAAGSATYINEGTNASCTFVEVGAA